MAIINYVTEIRFGVGCATELGEICQRLGFRRPLIVTDRGVVAAGLIGQLLELNPLPGHQVF